MTIVPRRAVASAWRSAADADSSKRKEAIITCPNPKNALAPSRDAHFFTETRRNLLLLLMKYVIMPDGNNISYEVPDPI